MKISRMIVYLLYLVILILAVQSDISFARSIYSDQLKNISNKPLVDCSENIQLITHDIGKIKLCHFNNGLIGRGHIDYIGFPPPLLPSLEYPYPNVYDHLNLGSLWIGAIANGDTLVSAGTDAWGYEIEFWPAPYPENQVVHRSINNPYHTNAISEQDFVSVFVDTVTDPRCVGNDFFTNRPHIPLNLRITQSSYAWSYSFADDFILFDYSIENIGQQTLEDAYIGIFIDADVGTVDSWADANDDICGFRRTIPAVNGCRGEAWLDTVNIAWIADNDGKVNSNPGPCPASWQFIDVTGVRILRMPNDLSELSFNWWIPDSDSLKDFGPRKSGTVDDPFYNFDSYLGSPLGDVEKYYMMRHEEIDYDQLFTALDHTNEGWLPPPDTPHDTALVSGGDVRYLLSVGPCNIRPGESVPFTFALIGGEDFHTDYYAFDNLFDPYNPGEFYDYLNFGDIGKNAVWASWIYDNPGVDTDGNGYKGPTRYCVYDSIWACDTILPDTVTCHWEYNGIDTIYTAGDGVPDFNAGIRPLAPIVRLEPAQDGILVRWNGFQSETVPDRFTAVNDTEGYNLYFSLDTVYGFIEFVSFYFDSSDPTDMKRIHKRFPYEPYPTILDIDSARLYYPEELIPEGDAFYFKYFEYQYFLKILIPDNDYCISVTAFDSVSESSLWRSTACAAPIGMPPDQRNQSIIPAGKVSIQQNHPNPFNPTTTIEYSLPSRSHVTISVYNLLGRKIGTIVDENKSLGTHTAVWSGRDDDGNEVASGIYFYQIQAGDFVESKKMLLLK